MRRPRATSTTRSAAFDGYGRLSGNTLADLRAGHRGDIEPDKRDPADFALWKAAGPGRLLKWPTARWGEGFPGWHLECSAMAMRYLGPRFDIHTGGIDNVFPHHEDEIAQSAPIVGDVPATHWVHGEFLLMDGKKMAKSAGNFQRVTELVDRGIDPLAFRYLVLTSRYCAQARVLGSVARCGRGRARVAAVGSARARGAAGDGPWAAPPVLAAGPAGDRPEGIASGVAGHGGDASGYEVTDRATSPSAPLSPAGRALHDRFVAAIDDDLDMPVALALLREILRSTLEPTSAAGSSSMPTRSLGSTSIASGRRESGDAAVPDEVRSPRRRPRRGPGGGRLSGGRRPAGAHRCARLGGHRHAGRLGGPPARLIGRRSRWASSERPPSGAADQPRGALATAGWTRRSRREPNRSMIR